MSIIANDLLKFIDESPTSFHAIKNVSNLLENNKFTELKQNEKWDLEYGKSYYISNEDASLIAFTLADDISKGFNITASHTDSPMVKIKPNAQIITNNHYIGLNIEVYGGPILSTWFDRGLSVAGRVMIKDNETIKSKLININRTLLTIPSIAIHLVRDSNETSSINKQTQMKPLIGFVEETFCKDDYLYKLIETELNCTKEEIIDFDLFLYPTQKGEIFGLNNELIHSKNLDDLFMVYTSLIAMINSTTNKSKVLILTDNEEIGSTSATGAESVFFENMLERIYLSLGLCREDFLIGLSNSLCVSGDLAHALHPNYSDRSDETNKPLLGKGIVFKYSANKSYSTVSTSSALFKNELTKKNIPYQEYVNRSDIRGGRTIGPIFAKKLGISPIDLGASILSMHSTREVASKDDVQYTTDALKCFYEIKENL